MTVVVVVVSSNVVDDGFRSLALTSLLARLAFALKASLGVTLRNLLSTGMLVSMVDQCLYTILNALLALGQYLVTKVGFFSSSGWSPCLLLVFELVLRALLVLVVNLMFLSCAVVLDLG